MRPVEQEPSNECLLRIQNEISEVEKRELELRKEHLRLSSPRTSVENSNGGMQMAPSTYQANDSDENIENSERSTISPPLSSPPLPKDVCIKDNFKKNKIIEPQPKPQLLVAPALTRALSQPQLFNISPVKITSPHRGIMQKFIASRGKLNVNQVNQPMQNANNSNFKKNLIMAPIEFNSDSIKALQNLDKSHIERDTKGRPIRKGYIPVEEKIQSELRDLKSRETELKRLHKLNVRDSEEEEELSSFEEIDDSEWSPINKKLSRSIDVLNETNLESSKPIPHPRNGNGIRPAVSLAALCDLDDAETPPSSHKLIERWEHIIQVNQQREKSYNIH